MYKVLNEIGVVAVGVVIGIIVGLWAGFSSTWKLEMKIQEAYWKIDVLNELKKQNVSKGQPVNKTIISIDNKPLPKGSGKVEVLKQEN